MVVMLCAQPCAFMAKFKFSLSFANSLLLQLLLYLTKVVHDKGFTNIANFNWFAYVFRFASPTKAVCPQSFVDVTVVTLGTNTLSLEMLRQHSYTLVNYKSKNNLFTVRVNHVTIHYSSKLLFD